MKHSHTTQYSMMNMAMQRTPIAVAIMVLQVTAFAQTAINTTSADTPDNKSLFETGVPGGTSAIGPRPFTSFMERLSSPVDKILIKVAGDNLPADGVQATPVSVQLLDIKGMPIKDDVEVTIEVNADARILLPGRTTSEWGVDRGDIDRIQPGVQAKAQGGLLQFKLIAPYKPNAVTLRISVKGLVEKVVVRYVPDLRKMMMVGLIEGRLRSDKFNPGGIVPVGQNDGFDEEIKGMNRDFNAGSMHAAGRAAVYLKGKIKGDYLLTVAYDSDKIVTRQLFQTIDPNTFYPVYGDSALRTVDAQSTGKLYVRLDKNLTYVLYGDYTTADNNPARQLSQYSRSLPGLKAHYEEGNIIANTFAAQQSLAQYVDEFPARGMSGPYSVSNPNGVKGTEKVEILVRDRNRPTAIISNTLLTALSDYDFEPFNGQIVFRAPVPSLDDQGNPVSIRITYEVDQGGAHYFVAGADARVKLGDSVTVGGVLIKDENPSAGFEMRGLNALVKLGPKTELIAEVASTNAVVNTNSLNANTTGSFAGRVGEVSGNAERVELRHADASLRARAYALRSDDSFYNPSSGVTAGKSDAGVSGAYQINPQLSVNAEVAKQDNRILGSTSTSGSVGVGIKVNPSLTINAGLRHVTQTNLTQQTLANGSCTSAAGSSSTANTTTGYNTGFGINQQGNQNIDPATGNPIVCTPAAIVPVAAVPATKLDASSLFVNANYKATPSVNLSGEVQKETNTDSSLLYRLGADWRVADKTRIYGRYENANSYSGIYGLGTGASMQTYALGIDTQYMKDGSAYNEYRLRDTGNANTVEAAVGLRNGWRLAEGWRLNTNLERTVSRSADASAVNPNVSTGATAAAVGLEYTANPLWKASGRVEWRKDNSNQNWLTTLSAVRKINRDWSVLFRDYYSLIQPQSGAADNRQNRAQMGLAFRPVDNNQVDALGLLEYKTQDDGASASSKTSIMTLRANYHPSRPWVLSTRLAAKSVNELLLSSVQSNYSAFLWGGRVTYDITNRYSIGALTTILQGQGGSKQYAYGLEGGWTAVDNLMLGLGYNWRGFVDKDLTGSDYMNRGWVLNLRYKF